MNKSLDIPALLATTAQQKKRLPLDLQYWWRLNKGLCPIHGQPMGLAPWNDPRFGKGEADWQYEPTPLECSIKHCSVRISVLDWNYPDNVDTPWCIEKIN